MIFEISFHTVEFIAKISTAKYIITTSNIPVINLAAINVHISWSNTFPLKDLLLKTHILFVIKANATASIHAIIVDGTLGICTIL